jgi:dTDP-4-dehydrorhamnose 3,5-epimerase
MEFLPTKIPDVVRIRPHTFADARGHFLEVWHSGRFSDAGLSVSFVQENQSQSVAGVIRGLHYQIRRPQGKLVRVLSGKIYDVAVDLRTSSPTFGQWVAQTLSADDRAMLWIPVGFAHGFCAEQPSEVAYLCTDHYAMEHERCIRYDDPALAIPWPTQGRGPMVSDKDLAGTLLSDAELFP